MAFDGEQHVGKAAEHVRADRLALIGAGHAPDLVGGDAEMVGPEPDQPLGESDGRAKRSFHAQLRLVEIDLPAGVGHRFGRGFECGIAFATLRACLRHRGRSAHWQLRLLRGALGEMTLDCRFAFASVTAR